MVATDLSIAEKITADQQRIQVDDAVVIRLHHDSEIRVIHGFLRSKKGVPAMITSSGTLLYIRPITRIDGKPYEYSSLTRDYARWN